MGGSANSGVIFRIETSGSGGLSAPSDLTATAVSMNHVDLEWMDNSTTELEFEIERCQGASCSNFAKIATAPASTETFADTTVVQSTTYRYRVRAVNDTEQSAYSNIDSVTTPAPGGAITVTTPNTAVDWAIGSTQRIKWTHDGGKGSTVKVQISRDGGTTWTTIASSVTNSGGKTGSYDWVVTAPSTGHARIRVAFTDDSAADDSNKDFTIGSPFVRVTSPNGSSTVWKSGTKASIKWASNLGALEKVKIELSKDGGASYPIAIVPSTPSDGAYSVQVPASWITSSAKVRVTWLDNAAIKDESDQTFVVK
jgi:hypothetical protein